MKDKKIKIKIADRTDSYGGHILYVEKVEGGQWNYGWMLIGKNKYKKLTPEKLIKLINKLFCP